MGTEIYDPYTSIQGFTLMQLKALEEYAKDLDMVRACREAGYKNPKRQAHMFGKNDKIKAEMQVIHDVWRSSLRMTSKHAAARHISLMDKFESDYDRFDETVSIKGQLASTLGKMSDSYLRATGTYGERESSGGGVVVNIDLSAGEVEVDSTGKKARVKSDG